MKYTVKTLSEMLGISVNTIRKYERLGVISPGRDEDNNYRLYDAVDVNIIRRVRYYTGFGLSIQEAAKLVVSGSLDDLEQTMEVAKQRSIQALALEQMRYRFICEKVAHVQRIRPMLDRCFIDDSPAMYGMIYRKDDDFYDDPATIALLRRWNDIHPFAMAAVFYDKTDFFRSDYTIWHGYLIDEKYAGFFGIHEGEGIRYYPSRRCLYIFATNPREPEIVYETSYKPLLEAELGRLGLEIDGDPFEQVIHTSHATGEDTHYVETWVPIRQMSTQEPFCSMK